MNDEVRVNINVDAEGRGELAPEAYEVLGKLMAEGFREMGVILVTEKALARLLRETVGDALVKPDGAKPTADDWASFALRIHELSEQNLADRLEREGLAPRPDGLNDRR